MFADDGRVNGAWIDIELFPEDVAQAFGVEQSAGPDDASGREPDSFWTM